LKQHFRPPRRRRWTLKNLLDHPNIIIALFFSLFLSISHIHTLNLSLAPSSFSHSLFLSLTPSLSLSLSHTHTKTHTLTKYILYRHTYIFLFYSQHTHHLPPLISIFLLYFLFNFNPCLSFSYFFSFLKHITWVRLELNTKLFTSQRRNKIKWHFIIIGLTVVEGSKMRHAWLPFGLF